MRTMVNLALTLVAILTVAACGSGNVRPEPESRLMVTAGPHLYRNNDPISMYYLFRLDLGGYAGMADVSVTGPAGWNEDQPSPLGSFTEGVHEVVRGGQPLDGTYTMTATFADVTLTATTMIDMSDRLPLITGFTAIAEEDGIAVSWDPVPGAVTYRVQFNDPDQKVGTPFPISYETTVVLPISLSELNPARQYSVSVLASTHDSNASDIDFSRQFMKRADTVQVQLP